MLKNTTRAMILKFFKKKKHPTKTTKKRKMIEGNKQKIKNQTTNKIYMPLIMGFKTFSIYCIDIQNLNKNKKKNAEN